MAIGSFLSNSDISTITTDVVGFVFPLFPNVGRISNMISGFMVVFLILKSLAEVLLRLTILYLEK